MQQGYAGLHEGMGRAGVPGCRGRGHSAVWRFRLGKGRIRGHEKKKEGFHKLQLDEREHVGPVLPVPCPSGLRDNKLRGGAEAYCYIRAKRHENLRKDLRAAKYKTVRSSSSSTESRRRQTTRRNGSGSETMKKGNWLRHRQGNNYGYVEQADRSILIAPMDADQIDRTKTDSFRFREN